MQRKNELAAIERRSFLKATALAGAGIASAALLGGCSSDPNDKEADSSGAGGSENISWDNEVDTLIVGAGGAAWGALAAADAGDGSVLIIEKGTIFGGTSGMSGGGLWVPNNYLMKEAGISDSREEALSYTQQIAMGKAHSEVMESYIDNSPKFLEWARNHGISWRFLREGGQFQDYYGIENYKPTGRPVELEPYESWKSIM